MRIFLSYPWQDREQAKSIYVALADQGHRVFFDRTDLPAGDEYHNRIRAAIENSHLVIFLISPDAIDAESYTLTEVEIAVKARVKLLPVMLRDTDIAKLPAAVQAVTIYRPDGNVAASVAAEVHRIAGAFKRQRLKRFSAALLAVALIVAGFVYVLNARNRQGLIGKDGAPAILIPAGSFIMGDDESSPRRELFVDAFYMDKFEITVASYAKFLQATGNVKTPEEWDAVFRTTGNFPWSASTGRMPTAIAAGRESVYPPKQSGKRPRAEPMSESIRGATIHLLRSGRDSPSPTRTRSTRTASRRSVPMPKARARLVFLIWRATHPNGSPTGIPKVFSAPRRATPKGRKAGQERCSAVAVGMTPRNGSRRLDACMRVRPIAPTTSDFAVPGT